MISLDIIIKMFFGVDVMLDSALAQLNYISKNLDNISAEELKVKLKELEKEIRESVLYLKKLRWEVLDNITEI